MLKPGLAAAFYPGALAGCASTELITFARGEVPSATAVSVPEAIATAPCSGTVSRSGKRCPARGALHGPPRRAAPLAGRPQPHDRARRLRLRAGVESGAMNQRIPRRHFVVVVALALFFVVACGDDSGPTAPSAPQFPQVAGAYTGPLTFKVPQLGADEQGTGMMNVVQSGAQVTITGSISFSFHMSEVPAITGTINQTGFFTPTAGGTTLTGEDPNCGEITSAASTITFSGRQMRIVETVGTQLCGSIELAGTLTR